MKKSIIILSILFLFSCAEPENSTSGHLYFKLVNFLPSNGMNNKELTKLNLELENSKATDSTGIQMIKLLKVLKTNHLLGKPFINLQNANNEIETIYLSQNVYSKIKKYNLEYLTKNNKKVFLKFKTTIFDKKFIYSDSLIEIREEVGVTNFRK